MRDSYTDIAKNLCALIVKHFVDDKITDETTTQEIIDIIKEMIDRALIEINEQDLSKRLEFHNFFEGFQSIMLETMDDHIICRKNLSKLAQVNHLTK